VILYISEQKKHHKERTFREEYLELLNKFEVKFKNEYLFEFYD
jgi:putative transposase